MPKSSECSSARRETNVELTGVRFTYITYQLCTGEDPSQEAIADALCGYMVDWDGHRFVSLVLLMVCPVRPRSTNGLVTQFMKGPTHRYGLSWPYTQYSYG